MPRKGRNLLTITLIVVALVVLFVLVIPLLIPKDQVRDWVVQRAEQQMQRPVAVDAVRAGLFPSPWVRLSGLELGEAPGQPSSRLSADALTLRLALGPLLRQRAEITSIVIERPRFEMVLADREVDRTQGPGSSGPGQPSVPAGDGPGAGDAAPRRTSDGQPQPRLLDGSGAGATGTPDGPTQSSSPAASPIDINIRELLIRDGSVSVRYPDGRSFLELGGIGERLSAQFSREAVIALEGETIVQSLSLHVPAGTLGRGLELRLSKRLSFDTNADRLTVEEASLELGDLPVALTGEVTGVSAGQPKADLHLTGGPARVENILGYLPDAILAANAGVRSSGTLALSAQVRGPLAPARGDARLLDGRPPAADFTVDLELSHGHIEHPQLPAALDEIAMRLRATPDTVEIRNFAVRSGENRLQARATVTDYASRPSLTAGLDADVDLAIVSRFQSVQDTGQIRSAPGSLRAGAGEAVQDPLQLGGRATAKLVLTGRLDQPQLIQANGTVRLRDVSAAGAQIPLPIRNLSGDLTLRGRDLRIHELAGNIGSSDIRGSGEIGNYRALDPGAWATGDVARADLNVRSRHLNLDELLPRPGEGGSDAATRGGQGAPPPAAALAILEGVIVAEVDELIVNRTRARDVKGRVRLERGRIRIESAGGLAFGGAIAGQGEIDLREPASPRFDMQMQARGVQAGELYGYAAGLGRFGQLGGFLTGEIDATANMRGALTDSLTLRLDGFSSDGTLQSRSASLTGHPLQRSLAGYLELPQLERLAITDWLQPFRIANGRVTVDGMNLKAGEIELSARGWQAIDGAVELGLELLLPQNLSAGIRKQIPTELQPILFDDAGASSRVRLPLTVTGRLPKPKLALDERRLRAGAEQRAKKLVGAERDRLEQEALRQASEFLKGLTDKSGAAADTSAAADSAAAAQPDARKQLEKEVRERLKGLFKR